MRATRGRNIMFSSESGDPILLRSPADIMNLCVFLYFPMLPCVLSMCVFSFLYVCVCVCVYALPTVSHQSPASHPLSFLVRHCLE
jgi:hypothetical protein